MNLSLPDTCTPRGNFLPYRKSGNIVYMSGQICEWNGEVPYRGPVGQYCTVEDAYKAAQICGLNLLFHLKAACDGDLGRVSAILRIGGFVNCLDRFGQSPAVTNGASDLMMQVFGERGRHARTAVGVRGLPAEAAVEIDMIVELTGI